MMTMFTACNGYALVETAEESIGGRTQVGLAIEVDNGVATPLQVKRGQTFYLNQIYLRASTSTKGSRAPQLGLRRAVSLNPFQISLGGRWDTDSKRSMKKRHLSLQRRRWASSSKRPDSSAAALQVPRPGLEGIGLVVREQPTDELLAARYVSREPLAAAVEAVLGERWIERDRDKPWREIYGRLSDVLSGRQS